MTDRDLVSQVMSGNTQAFKMLIKHNERLVAHMVGKLISNREEHEEICQDVFLKVYNKLGEFNFQSKLSTWIATIAYRHAINAARKNKHRFIEIAEGENDGVYFTTEETPESLISEKDTEEYVHRLIDCLPPQYKVVLNLYHVESMNYQEIGAITGMPEGTVKSYLFRARTLLKEKVKQSMINEPGI